MYEYRTDAHAGYRKGRSFPGIPHMKASRSAPLVQAILAEDGRRERTASGFAYLVPKEEKVSAV